MLVSWKNYKERAWGHDEIAPISGGAKDWVGMSVSMLDALSTLYLMGLKDEFEDELAAPTVSRKVAMALRAACLRVFFMSGLNVL